MSKESQVCNAKTQNILEYLYFELPLNFDIRHSELAED